MTPIEKAMQLVNNFWLIEPLESQEGMEIQMAIECALIAVNEILNVLWHTHKNEEAWRYYLEVKQEIEKL